MQNRIEFEKWLLDEHLLEGTWNEQRNCYNEFACHLAYCAWKASQLNNLKQQTDSAKYRWLIERNFHYMHNTAWLSPISVKKKECDIFTIDEASALLDAEVNKRMSTFFIQTST